MPLELLPLEELGLRVTLSIRLVLEDNSYSVQAAELRSVTVEVLGSTITYSSSVKDLAVGVSARISVGSLLRLAVLSGLLTPS